MTLGVGSGRLFWRVSSSILGGFFLPRVLPFRGVSGCPSVGFWSFSVATKWVATRRFNRRSKVTLGVGSGRLFWRVSSSILDGVSLPRVLPFRGVSGCPSVGF